MISIIIPVLNEANSITNLCAYLYQNAHKDYPFEIYVVDGGSTDGTKENITQFIKKERFQNLFLINADRGRAKQMNAGAKQANGSILYFLHADSFPPKHFNKHIINAVAQKKLAGCFRMRFNDSHWWLTLVAWFTRFNWKACRGGDQSLFVSKTVFEKLKGFNEAYIIYEDNHFIGKLYKHKTFTVLPYYLYTSARKYRSIGVWTLQYHFLIIYFKRALGATPEALYAYYKTRIK